MRETTPSHEPQTADEARAAWARPARAVGLGLAVGTVFAILAPLDTGGMGWPGVWFYWAGIMTAGWLIAMVLSPVLWNRFPQSLPEPARIFIHGTTVAVPVTGIVVTVSAVGFQTPLAFGWIAQTFLYTLVISLMMSGLGYLLDQRSPAHADASPESGAPTVSADAFIRERLPASLRDAQIVAVVSEDHYLRIYTDRGSDLILMRLSDALAALAGLDGLQTHRSWWVARTGVSEVVRDGAKMTLKLVNGVEAPVSRTHAPKLREAGWR